MHQSEQGSPWHVLGNDGQIWGLRNSSKEEQHIDMSQPLHDARLSAEFLHARRFLCEEEQRKCGYYCNEGQLVASFEYVKLLNYAMEKLPK